MTSAPANENAGSAEEENNKDEKKRKKKARRKAKKAKRLMKRKRELERERESESESEEEDIVINGSRITIVSQPILPVALQISRIKSGMAYLKLGDDDSWMRGTWLMEKRLSSASSTNRLGHKASYLDPYIFKFFMTIVEAYHEIGLDNFLIMEDVKLEGEYHLPLFCQYHFLSGLSGRTVEPIFSFRVFSKSKKEMRKGRALIKKGKGEICKCREFAESDLYDVTGPRVYCGRYWRSCLNVLIDRLGNEIGGGDFSSPFAYTIVKLDGTQYEQDAVSDVEAKTGVETSAHAVNDNAEEKSSVTSYPPSRGMTSDANAESEANIQAQVAENDQMMQAINNESEHKSVGVAATDIASDGQSGNIATMHISNMGELNVWLSRSDSYVANLKEQVSLLQAKLREHVLTRERVENDMEMHGESSNVPDLPV
jgi:hypothetical protein